MSWFSVIPVALACLALLFIPGMLIAAALGAIRWPMLAVAPALTVAIVALTAIIAPYLGIAWSVIPVLLVTLVLAALLLVARKLQQRTLGQVNILQRRRGAGRLHILTAAGFLIGSTSIVLQLRTAFGRPENISQTFDNVFHLNAIQYVLNSHSASSLTLTEMTNGDNPPYFYPAAWHGLASLLVQITGAEISVAVNVLNLCIASTVWTAGCMLLVRTLVGPNAYALAAAGVVAAGFGSFPLLLLDFGVLYPNFLSVSLLPAGLACVSMFFGVSESLEDIGIARFALAPLAAVGIAIAHPNGLMSLLALSVPLLAVSFVALVGSRHRLGLSHRRSLLTGAGLVAMFTILAVLWKYIRPPAEAATWLPIQTQGQAVGEIITNSAMQRPPAWAISILVIAGIVVISRFQSRIWLLGSFAVAGGLFIAVSGGPDGDLRDLLTGVWYNDSYRLAALLPVVAVPLAAIGAGWLMSSIHQRWIRHRPSMKILPSPLPNPGLVFSLAGPLAMLVVLAIAQNPPLTASIQSARANYSISPDSPLVSSDEMALINELDEFVPADATIAVNPWTGGAMAFAVADRNTTSKHTLTTYTKSTELLNDKLRTASTDPEVCEAARQDSVRYVLDFGTKEVHGGNHGFDGLRIPPGTPGFKLLKQSGEAKLFELTACS